MSFNLGIGASAKCVLSPSFELDKLNIDNDMYVTKISKLNLQNISSIENYILFNEFNIGEYLRKNNLYDILNKYTSLVEKYIILDYIDFNDKYIKTCNLLPNEKYILLFSKNGACKKLKKNDSVIVNNKIGSISKIIDKNYYVSINNMIKPISIEYIKRYCGNLTNEFSILKSFKTLQLIKKNFLLLINGLELLHKNNIIHTDIKLENIVCNTNGELRIIDFGGAINLKNPDVCKNNYELPKKILFNNLSTNKYYLYNTIIKTYTMGYVPPEIILFLKLINLEVKKEPVYTSDILLEELNKFKFEKITKSYIDFILYNKTKLFDNMFCNDILVSKFDIYSLGIVFKKIYMFVKTKLKFNNKKLEDLIEKMTTYDVFNRFTLKQVKSHAFFKN